ncbi:MAG: DUF3592 domain-containing protein [Thiotrichales bacterium]|nr:DUF3592 domain-containing protein [Thiotrichales bacterium]
MNYYVIILLLVFFGGIAVTIWGWKILKKSQAVGRWPTTKGNIVVSSDKGKNDEHAPNIQYQYVIDGKSFQQSFQFPSDVESMPELSARYVNKYPVGCEVKVYYNPVNPDDAVLESRLQGDWMIFVMGIVTTMAAGFALLS